MKDMESLSRVKTELVAFRDRHRVTARPHISRVTCAPHHQHGALHHQHGAQGRQRGRTAPRAGDNVPISSVPTVPSVSLPAKGTFLLLPNTCPSSHLCPPALGWQRQSGEAKGKDAMPATLPVPSGHPKKWLPHPAGTGCGVHSADAAHGNAAHGNTAGTAEPPWHHPNLQGGSTPENPCAASSQGTGGGCNLWLLAGITPARRRARSPASTGTAAPAMGFGTASVPDLVSE